MDVNRMECNLPKRKKNYMYYNRMELTSPNKWSSIGYVGFKPPNYTLRLYSYL